MASETQTTESANQKPQVAASDLLLMPRISEKAQVLATQNKYVFVVPMKANKVTVRKAVEKQYGVKVQQINMMRIEGKPRRYGRTLGKLSDYKKAIITVTKDSKKINFVEGA